MSILLKFKKNFPQIYAINKSQKTVYEFFKNKKNDVSSS